MVTSLVELNKVCACVPVPQRHKHGIPIFNSLTDLIKVLLIIVFYVIHYLFFSRADKSSSIFNILLIIKEEFSLEEISSLIKINFSLTISPILHRAIEGRLGFYIVF